MPVTRPHAWVWLGVAAAVACVLAAGGLARGDVAGGGARVANGRPDWGGWRGVGPNPAPLLPLSGWVHDGQARPGPAPPLRRPPSPPLPESHPALARTGTRGGGAGAVGTQASVAASPHAPEQVMLSLEGPGAVTVSWVTHPQDDPALRPRILLAAAAAGTSSSSSLARKPGHHHRKPGGGGAARAACRHLAGLPLASVVRYARADGAGPSFSAPSLSHGSFSCYSAGTYLSGALHRATMGPLDPGVPYSYSVGDPERGWSTAFNFTAPLAPGTGASAAPYTLAVVGDLGQTADSADTLAAIVSRGLGGPAPGAVQSVLNVGDLSYADGFQDRWDTFGRLVEPLASRVFHAVIEGNHEEELAGGRAGFLAYEARYATPSNASGSGTPLYYSYDLPSAHVAMLGTYADWGPGSPQRAWLAADLAAVDRARTPWLVVGMHAPWYSSNTAHLDEVDGMRASLEPLLLEHGADLVFCGHVHAYERTHRVARRRRHACGPAHVVIGDGGNREGLALHYISPQPKWSVYREASFGHGALTFANATHARWEWVRNQDGPGAVPGDAAWFVRGGGGGACSVADRAGLVAAAQADFVASLAGAGLSGSARTAGVGYATETAAAVAVA